MKDIEGNAITFCDKTSHQWAQILRAYPPFRADVIGMVHSLKEWNKADRKHKSHEKINPEVIQKIDRYLRSVVGSEFSVPNKT